MLLADAQRLAVGTHQALRQAITQPATGTGENFNIFGMQTNLFVQLAVKRLLGGLVLIDTALRELPGILSAYTKGTDRD